MSLVLPPEFVLPIAGALEIIAACPYIAIGFQIKAAINWFVMKCGLNSTWLPYFEENHLFQEEHIFPYFQPIFSLNEETHLFRKTYSNEAVFWDWCRELDIHSQ